ncbi:MAG: TatD family hydrolase [Candidatus Heimdallarchaeota archaeon]|nr:TatD family hydrolase [Candidatus Heimdallarchaeota archaeon]MCK5298218.1 TatD family hydrolase [Candidatus Heimdallarchaeota archaeon]
MYIDTHLHLHDPYFDSDKLDLVVDDITKNKIVTWVQSCDLPTYEVILERCAKSEYLFPSFGILPWYAHKYVDQFDEITKLAEEAIMLGEIGLDEKYAKDKECIPHQLPLFEIYLKEAEKNNKIMNCHFRGKLLESFEIVKSYKAKKIIFHSYTGDEALIKDIIDCGYYYSIGPWHPEEKLKFLPNDLLLLEIDTLPREPFKASSVMFSEMVEKVAKIKGTTPEEIEAMNHRNVLKLTRDDPNLSEMNKLLEEK